MILNHSCQQTHLNNLCHEDTVDDQCYVIPHQHGGDKIIRVAEEARKDARRDTRLPFHFKTKLIHGNKSNLHTREEGGESHGY